MPAAPTRDLVICADGSGRAAAALAGLLEADVLVVPGPAGALARVRRRLAGDGIAAAVARMAAWLSARWQPGDRLWLFGQGDGAFAVRAFAALLYRVGLLPADAPAAAFREAWRLLEGSAGHDLQRFRARHRLRSPGVHFLGLWDSPRCCGVLRPLDLPHLRHNPAVHVVRHAVAADERRGWLELMPWGWLASDRQPNGKALGLPAAVQSQLAAQDVQEVLFAGRHADLGEPGHPALTWMLAEAVLSGLRPSASGLQRLQQHVRFGDAAPPPPPVRTLADRCADLLGRRVPGHRRAAWVRGPAPREPAALRRSAPWVGVHVSAPACARGVPAMPVPTRSRRALAAALRRARPPVQAPADPPEKPGPASVFLHRGRELTGST